MIEVYTAPETIPDQRYVTIFLGGSIEQGKAEHWQIEFIDHFKYKNITILNPRRLIWEASPSDEYFAEQVNWELDGLDIADIIIIYLQPGTLSPVSLLELGLFAKSDNDKLIVCCPGDYFRSGNVNVVCSRYNIPLFKNKIDFFNHIEKILK